MDRRRGRTKAGCHWVPSSVKRSGNGHEMLTIKPRFETFEEYLGYNDNSENFYELFNGELIEMPPESGFNIQIANRLFLVFALMLGSDRVQKI
jgi:Uma2 family endonuclease